MSLLNPYSKIPFYKLYCQTQGSSYIRVHFIRHICTWSHGNDLVNCRWWRDPACSQTLQLLLLKVALSDIILRKTSLHSLFFLQFFPQKEKWYAQNIELVLHKAPYIIRARLCSYNVWGCDLGFWLVLLITSQNKDIYLNRKQCHRNNRIVFNADYMILDIVAKWLSSTHESTVVTPPQKSSK